MRRLELAAGGFAYVEPLAVEYIFDLGPDYKSGQRAQVCLASGRVFEAVGAAKEVAERLGFAHPTNAELGLGPDPLPSVPLGTFEQRLEDGSRATVRLSASRHYGTAAAHRDGVPSNFTEVEPIMRAMREASERGDEAEAARISLEGV